MTAVRGFLMISSRFQVSLGEVPAVVPLLRLLGFPLDNKDFIVVLCESFGLFVFCFSL